MQSYFHDVCRALHLGDMTEPPTCLSGGYTHRMYALHTTQGHYAVKLLNPEIMQRPDARDNYACAEAHEHTLEASGLPILPALIINGQKMQRIGGQYLYVFEYFDGHVLKETDVTPAHCAAMGSTLARIHAHGRCVISGMPEPAAIDWPALTAALLREPESRACGSEMHRSLPMLIRMTRASERAIAELPHQAALCHNDMDTKNVLWQGDDFRIIDLESLSVASPEQELLDLAISWAGYWPDEAKFRSFISAYRAAGGTITADPAALFDSRRNHLEWLSYNARRALFDDPVERRTGRRQIEKTLAKLNTEQRFREQILSWMEDTQHL